MSVHSVAVFTSNNARFSEELQRRLSLIRLDAKCADPKMRSNWRHPDISAYIEVNRERILWAVLTLVAAWVDAGAHGPKCCPAIASYPGFSYVIGGILEFIGPAWTQFQANRADLATFAAAGEEGGFEELISAWAEAGGGPMLAAELGALVDQEGFEIDGLKLTRDGNVSPRSLSGMLGTFLGRRFRVCGREVALEKAGKRRKVDLFVLRECDDQIDREHTTTDGAPRVPHTFRAFPLTPRESSAPASMPTPTETSTTLSSRRRRLPSATQTPRSAGSALLRAATSNSPNPFDTKRKSTPAVG